MSEIAWRPSWCRKLRSKERSLHRFEGSERLVLAHDMPTSPFTDDFIPEFVVYQADPSSHDFTPAFYAAINKFHKITGNSLDTHPFAKQLDTCPTPQQVLNALQTQLTPFSKLRILNQRERLMGRLDPIVRIVHMLSEMLEQGIGLVSILDHLHVTVLWHPVLSHFHLQKKSSLLSVFFSEYVSHLTSYFSFMQ